MTDLIMQYTLLLVALPPLGGFLLLALDPARIASKAVVAIALAAGIAPAVILIPLSIACFSGVCSGDLITSVFTLTVGENLVEMAVRLDPLGAVAGITVSVIAACVMVYSVDYMAHAETADLRRFFALMNLFLGAMLTVVLAGDSVILFLGWELMGLCSFFLIAYYVTEPRSIAAGRKAFVITRIADAMLLAALLILFLEAGSIRLDRLIPAGAAMEDRLRPLIAALLLAGALGKSAQLPFHTWLPTAMAGPTPVSALLHSATMVAAGAFLLARFAPMFATTPSIAAAMATIGVATAAFGALCAVAQTDVKRLLAYSSISQIGMMVLAVGVGAPAVAMAHFVAHAVFKSLLFLSAGMLSHAGDGTTSIAGVRGVWRRSPVAFWTFTAGAASLSGLPIVTAGWWSKEAIFAATHADGWYGWILWAVAVVAAVLTAAYAFRPVFTALRPLPPGQPQRPPVQEGVPTVVPLILLAAAALAGGFVVKPLVGFLGGHVPHPDLVVEIVGAAAALAGVALAYALTHVPVLAARLARARRVRAGFQLDAVYYALLVRPYRHLVDRVNGGHGWLPDPVGTIPILAAVRLMNGVIRPLLPDRLDLAWIRGAGAVLDAAEWSRRWQTGRVRDYALAMGVGAVGLLVLVWGTAWR